MNGSNIIQCPYRKKAVRIRKGDTKTEQKRKEKQEDATLLALKMKDGALSQEMRVDSRNQKRQ